MEKILPKPKHGDLFLLFHNLPYDFSVDLPLLAGPNVCLDNTPQDWLDSAKEGLADYLLPGYSLGIGLNHCCLRCFSNYSVDQELTPVDLLFLTLLALRLRCPLDIRIGGQFRVGNDDNRILKPALYQLSTSWNIGIGNLMRYTPSLIAESAAIAGKLIIIGKRKLTRLETALIFFSQVTLGRSSSYQLSYLALFSALESLFVPSGNKATTLSQRISHFLCNFQFPEPMEKWIKDEYINGRHKLAHGIHDAAFGTKLRPERHQSFGRLHEITRLSLLGFLSMDSQELEELSKGSGRSLQNALNNLGPASGDFIKDQKVWAS